VPDSTTVLGIDPGSRRLGWAVVALQGADLRRIDGGVVRLAGSLPDRLGALLSALQEVIARHAIDALAIEAAFVHDNARTALVLGQARGIPIALCAARGLAVHEYAPAHVKRATVGSGRADKHQVQQMVCRALGLATVPAEDEADALAVAVVHLRELGFAAVLPPVAGRGAPAAAPTAARQLYLDAIAAAAARARRAP